MNTDAPVLIRKATPEELHAISDDLMERIRELGGGQ